MSNDSNDSNGSNTDPTLVERWLQDQQQWQRTLFAYLDSMMKNDEFLVHMGNAMRGSLLAGKPYPTAAPPEAPAEDPATADRLDKILFAVHQLQGQMKDLQMTLDEIKGLRKARVTRAGPSGKAGLPAVAGAAATRNSRARSPRKAGKAGVPAVAGAAAKAGKRRTRS